VFSPFKAGEPDWATPQRVGGQPRSGRPLSLNVRLGRSQKETGHGQHSDRPSFNSKRTSLVSRAVSEVVAALLGAMVHTALLGLVDWRIS